MNVLVCMCSLFFWESAGNGSEQFMPKAREWKNGWSDVWWLLVTSLYAVCFFLGGLKLYGDFREVPMKTSEFNRNLYRALHEFQAQGEKLSSCQGGEPGRVWPGKERNFTNPWCMAQAKADGETMAMGNATRNYCWRNTLNLLAGRCHLEIIQGVHFRHHEWPMNSWSPFIHNWKYIATRGGEVSWSFDTWKAIRQKWRARNALDPTPTNFNLIPNLGPWKDWWTFLITSLSAICYDLRYDWDYTTTWWANFGTQHVQ